MTGYATPPNQVFNFGGGRERKSTIAASGAAHVLDLDNGNLFDLTLSANCVLTLAHAIADDVCSFTVLLRQGTGGHTVTWFPGVKWAGGNPPVLSTGAGKVDVFSFLTTDGGATIYGFTAGSDVR